MLSPCPSLWLHWLLSYAVLMSMSSPDAFRSASFASNGLIALPLPYKGRGGRRRSSLSVRLAALPLSTLDSNSKRIYNLHTFSRLWLGKWRCRMFVPFENGIQLKQEEINGCDMIKKETTCTCVYICMKTAEQLWTVAGSSSEGLLRSHVLRPGNQVSYHPGSPQHLDM